MGAGEEAAAATVTYAAAAGKELLQRGRSRSRDQTWVGKCVAQTCSSWAVWRLSQILESLVSHASGPINAAPTAMKPGTIAFFMSVSRDEASLKATLLAFASSSCRLAFACKWHSVQQTSSVTVAAKLPLPYFVCGCS